MQRLKRFFFPANITFLPPWNGNAAVTFTTQQLQKKRDLTTLQ